MTNPPSNEQSGEPGLTFDQMIKVSELGFEGFKWFDEQGNEAIKVAARTLWLSNAGGLALVVGFAAKVENLTQYGSVAIVLAAIAFILGVYLGAIPHVRVAHRIAQFQLSCAELARDAASNGKSLDEIYSVLIKLLPDFEKKSGVITEYLVRAQLCLGVGAFLGVLGLSLAFLSTF